ncbi:diacylglycerol kinase family lipid kinase [Paenibacillus psychroresistens]|uniref:Diacylglycerol kinase family lipid kinase n=1 Tax=Paenibacillus psychroresistens TaxID=1778678 RepID=A0A6B8RR37_9BACL|nr:diacylglycerol kinase family protein [Paenibacillus psychroresistens]QGQ98317.1 diacylglycerol kinase family lipid kinase [Paenibacillus psychroresistens]
MIGIIINPLSGNGQGKKTWLRVEKELEERKTAYIHKATSYGGEAYEIAAQMVKADEVKRIIVIGGDGTINEVVNGIVDAGGATSCALAVIPAGTGNDYAKAHEIPKNSMEALNLALSPTSTIKQIDLIHTNSDNLAINNIGAGFDGLVAKLTNEAAYKKLLNRLGLGSLAYFITMMRVFGTYKHCTIWLEVDGISHELTHTWLAATANIPFYGGSMQICPQALSDDGYLDVVVIRSPSRWKVLSILFSVYSGKHVNHPAVTFYKGRSISIRSAAPLLLQADGEAAGETPVQLKIVPRGISIIAGPPAL